MKRNIIISFAWGILFSSTILISLHFALLPAYTVNLPEELPNQYDVLMVNKIEGRTIELGYYAPHGEDLANFPNWYEADCVTGIEHRYSDLWCVAASGAVNRWEFYNILSAQHKVN